MQVCKICGRESRAKNLCSNHYSQLRQYGKTRTFPPRPWLLSHRKCKIKNCNREYCAKGYCRRHYNNWKKAGRALGKSHKCKAINCFKLVSGKYCLLHQIRLRRNLPLDLTIKFSPKGERNYRWNGGRSEYPDHYLMKKNRLIILMHNPKCEMCDKPATEIHHKDFSKTNHKLSNLMAVCRRCNGKLRNPNKPNISKFRRLYGMTGLEMANKLGFSEFTIWNWHSKGILESMVKSNQNIFL